MQTVIKKKPIQRAAVLHDLCTVGKAAMTNILPVLSVMGIEACPVPTMVLSTHTGGFGRPAVHTLKGFPKECQEHLKAQGFSFDAVLVGYLGNADHVREAEHFLQAFSSGLTVFDPIMADHGRFYSNFDDSYRELLMRLIPFSSVVTPNYTESCLLTGEAYEENCSWGKFLRITEKLRASGAVRGVITSISTEKDSCAVGIFDENREEWIPYRPSGRPYPGTGDLFSAVLLGGLMKGWTLRGAVERAHGFVALCIEKSDEAGYDTREGVLLEPLLAELVKTTSKKF